MTLGTISTIFHANKLLRPEDQEEDRCALTLRLYQVVTDRTLSFSEDVYSWDQHA